MTELYRVAPDSSDAHITVAGMCALLGVAPAELNAAKTVDADGDSVFTMRPEWIKAGNRRRKEYEAATGNANPFILDVIDHFAASEAK